MSEIIDFYNSKQTSSNHNLLDIWNFSIDDLENTHDYIQWLFPLNEPSEYNPGAILTEEDIESFSESPILRWRLMNSVHVFMLFLHNTTDEWIRNRDHNHLRITRMLRCLNLIGMKKQAEAAYDELIDIVCFFREYNKDSGLMKEAQKYWDDALMERINDE